ncbi:MAG: FAD-binding oxidoreductase [Acetobacterales bacterium]
MTPTDSFDTAVIGGGLMGCGTALRLARGGRRVVVLERRGLCMEASGVNAGSLSPMIKRAALMPYALRSYDMWQNTREWLGGDIEAHRKSGLILAFTEREAELLEKMMRERIEAGAPAEMIGGNRAKEIEPSLADGVILAAWSQMDGHGNSSRTGHVFHHAMTEAGVDIRQGTTVQGIAKTGAGFEIGTDKGDVRAETVVLAGGAWLGRMGQWLGVDLPIGCKVNQMSVTERMPRILSTVVNAQNGLLTMKQPPNGTVVIGGGWQARGDIDMDPGTREIIPGCLTGNVQVAVHAIPAMRQARLVRSWIGLEALTPDMLPLIGPLPGVDGAFVIGACRGGWEIGPCLGEILGDHMLGREPALPLFDPGRPQPQARWAA